MNNYKNILLCKWGFGDKLLTAVSIITISKLTDTSYQIIFNAYLNKKYVWGDSNYNIDIINFNNLNIINTVNEFQLYLPEWTDFNCKSNKTMDLYKNKFINTNIIDINGPIPLSPIGIYLLFKKKFTYEFICDTYLNICKQIEPSFLIESNLPNNINNCIGIHLRGTDKIVNGRSKAWESSINEYNDIIYKIKKYIDFSINNNDKYFYITGDSQEKVEQLTKYIKNNNGIVVNYTYDTSLNNIHSFKEIIDFFSLSKCKIIVQGIKASTYSLMASIIGSNKLINFSNLLDNQQLLYYNLFKYQNVDLNPELDYVSKYFYKLIKEHRFSLEQYIKLT